MPPNSILLGNTPVYRDRPSMFSTSAPAGTFFQDPRYPLTTYRGWNPEPEAPPVPHVATPEEIAAQAQNQNGGDGSTGGPSGPSVGDPFDGSRSAFGISNYSSPLGNFGSLAGLATGVPGLGGIAGTLGAALDASKANPSLGVIGVEPIGIMGMLEAGVLGGLLGGRNIEAQYLDAIAAKEPQVAAMMSMYGLAPTPEQLAAMQANPTPSVTAPSVAAPVGPTLDAPLDALAMEASMMGANPTGFGTALDAATAMEGSMQGSAPAEAAAAAAAANAAAAMEGSMQGATPGDDEGGGGPAEGGPGGGTGGSNAGTGDSDQGGVSDAASDASYRVGGQIPADGDGRLETKPITAHEGEFVLTPEAVQMLGGPEKLAAINEAAMSGGMIQSDEGMPLTRDPVPGMQQDMQQDIAPRLRGGSVLLNGGESEPEPLNLNQLALQSAMLGGKPQPQRPMMMGG